MSTEDIIGAIFALGVLGAIIGVIILLPLTCYLTSQDNARMGKANAASWENSSTKNAATFEASNGSLFAGHVIEYLNNNPVYNTINVTSPAYAEKCSYQTSKKYALRVDYENYVGTFGGYPFNVTVYDAKCTIRFTTTNSRGQTIDHILYATGEYDTCRGMKIKGVMLDGSYDMLNDKLVGGMGGDTITQIGLVNIINKD